MYLSVRNQCGMSGTDVMYMCIRFLCRFRSATSICPKFATDLSGVMLAQIFKNVLPPITHISDWRTVTFFWNKFNPSLVYCNSSRQCHITNFNITRSWLTQEGYPDGQGGVMTLNDSTASALMLNEKCCGLKSPSGRKICYYTDPLLHPCISPVDQRKLLSQRQTETTSNTRSTGVRNSGPIIFSNYCAACMTAVHFITAYKFVTLVGLAAWLVNYVVLTGLSQKLQPACKCNVVTVSV